MEPKLGRRAAHVNVGECRSTEELPVPGFWARRSQGGFSPAVPGTARQGRCAPQAQASVAVLAQNDMFLHVTPRPAGPKSPLCDSPVVPPRLGTPLVSGILRSPRSLRMTSPLNVIPPQEMLRECPPQSTPPPFRLILFGPVRLLGFRVMGHAGDIDHHYGLVPNNPGIVSRRQPRHIAWTKLFLHTVIHSYPQPS